ncbi:MAG: hypothetical protein L3K18_09685 [Thermoplasmata archaeon]|nr:hypothetical protein [Thermoplasmata archaeon]
MVAAGLASQEGSAIAAEVIETGKEIWRDFSADPIMWAADKMVKFGFVAAIGGAVSWAISTASARQEQAYLNDMQTRLGLPLTVSPTPPKPSQTPPPPVPTLGQTTMAICAGSVYNLDLTNAYVSGQKCIDAAGQLQTLLDNLVSQGGSKDAIAGCVLGIEYFGLAAQQFDWAPPGTPVTDFPQNPNLPLPANGSTTTSWIYVAGGLTGFGPYWGQAEDWIWVASNATNQVAQALNLPVPFNVPTSAPGAPPPPKPATNTTFGWLNGFTTLVVGAVTTLGQDAIQGVTDVGQFFQGVSNDIQQFSGDVGKAIAYGVRVILNFPILLWDGLGYGVTWGTHTLFGDLAPLLLFLGIGLIVAGMAIKGVYPRLAPRIELLVNARSARFWNRVDRKLGIKPAVKEVKTLAATETLIAQTNALAEPVEAETSALLLPPAPAETSPEAPPSPPGPLPQEIPPPSLPDAPASILPQSDSPPETPATVPEPPPPPEAPVPATEAEKEDILGEQPTLREQKMALSRPKPVKRREPTADELLEMANSFTPTDAEGD